MNEKGPKIANALRVNLNQKINADFRFIKEFHGIESDSDTIRFLIRKEKKKIIKKGLFKHLDMTEIP